MSSKAKQILLWLMIISSALLFVYFIQRTQGKSPTEVSYDKIWTQIENKDTSEVYIRQDSVEITDKSNNKFYAKVDNSDALRGWLREVRGGLRGLQLKHIEAVERLILSQKSGKTVELPGRGRVVKGSGRLTFENIRVDK